MDLEGLSVERRWRLLPSTRLNVANQKDCGVDELVEEADEAGKVDIDGVEYGASVDQYVGIMA